MKLEDNSYTSNLDIASGVSIKTIKGIETFLLGQRLKYQKTLDPEEQISFQEALKNNSAYEETDANYGIESATQSTNYLTLQDTAGNSLKPHPVLGDTNFTHQYPIEQSEEDILTGTSSQDTSVATREPATIDILDGPNDNKNVYKTGPKQVLKGNTMDEYYESMGNIDILGTNVNVLGATGVGGMVSQASSSINNVTSMLGLGDVINKQDDDPLYSDNAILDTKKNEYLKSINLQYANSRIYNRLTNVANSAASAANPLASQNFNFDINHDSLGTPFVNWWSNFAGDADFNPTFVELLQLDTANFNTLSLMNARPEIAVKHKKDQRVKGGLVQENGVRATNTTSLTGQPLRKIESGNEDIGANGLALSVLDSDTKDPPRLDTYPEGRSFNQVANYTAYTRAVNSFGYPDASQEFDKNKYQQFLDSQMTDLYNFNINTIRPDNDLRTIRHLLDNTKSHTITTTNYSDSAMVPYHSTLKSQEESAQIRALIEKNNFLKELGYIYVRPYPGTFRYTSTGIDDQGLKGEHSINFENFTIPFEFQPKITEASTTVQYATEEMLNHTGSLKTYIRTEPGVVTLETEYLALCENNENVFSGKMNEFDNDISKNFGIDAWQYLWDLKKIDSIEKAYRSLAFPVNSQSTVTPGIVKPPMIKILMQTDPNKELTVGNLYRYPYTKYSGNNGFNFLGDAKTNGFYLQNMQIDNKDQFRTYKTYICTDVNISYDDERFAMVVPSYFRMKSQTLSQVSKVTEGEYVEDTKVEFVTEQTGHTNIYDNISANPIYKVEQSDSNNYYQFRGFKVTLNLVEITENYLDAIPDFAAYYVKYMQQLRENKDSVFNIVSDVAKNAVISSSDFNNFLQMSTSDLVAMATEIGNIKEIEVKYQEQQIIINNQMKAKQEELKAFNAANESDINLINEYGELLLQCYNNSEVLESKKIKLDEFTEKSNITVNTLNSLMKFTEDSGNLPAIIDANKLEKLLDEYEMIYFKDFKSEDGKSYSFNKQQLDDFNNKYIATAKQDMQMEINSMTTDLVALNKKADEKREEVFAPEKELFNPPVKEALPNGEMFEGTKAEFLIVKQQQLQQQQQDLEKKNDVITQLTGGILSDGKTEVKSGGILGQARQDMLDYVQTTSSTFIGNPLNTQSYNAAQESINAILTQVNTIPG